MRAPFLVGRDGAVWGTISARGGEELALDISTVFCYNPSMDAVVKSNQNIVYSCHYHIVFCPKYRRKVLVNGVDTRLKVLLRETIEKWGQELVECEVMPDHVHLLVGCDPQFGIHRLVKFVKGATSHQLRQEFPLLKKKLPSLWTNSYYCGTTGGVTLETIRKYVENQKGK